MPKKDMIEVPIWWLVAGFSLAVLLAAFALKRCAGNQSASLTAF
jgi:hypothetical protein